MSESSHIMLIGNMPVKDPERKASDDTLIVLDSSREGRQKLTQLWWEYNRSELPLKLYSFNTEMALIGPVLAPKSGDIFINGDRNNPTASHSGFVMGSFRQKNKDYITIAHCMGGINCFGSAFYIGRDMSTRKKPLRVLRYIGPRALEVWENLVSGDIEKMASLSTYNGTCILRSVLKRCETSDNDLLKRYGKKYSDLLDVNLPMKQICSSFVILAYLVAFHKAGIENMADIMPLNPRYCWPVNIAQLAELRPQYWQHVDMYYTEDVFFTDEQLAGKILPRLAMWDQLLFFQ